MAPLAVPAHDEHGGGNPLHDKMEAMQDPYRTLGRSLRRPDSADLAALLEAVHQLQLLTVETKVMVPKKVETVAEAERAAFVLAYRQKQIATLMTLLELEQALLEGDVEQAAEIYSAVRTHRSEGHAQFQDD
ncbi:MAG: hypothetical protein ACFBZ8_07335 [Opitutales bacterium]